MLVTFRNLCSPSQFSQCQEHALDLSSGLSKKLELEKAEGLTTWPSRGTGFTGCTSPWSAQKVWAKARSPKKRMSCSSQKYVLILFCFDTILYLFYFNVQFIRVNKELVLMSFYFCITMLYIFLHKTRLVSAMCY